MGQRYFETDNRFVTKRDFDMQKYHITTLSFTANKILAQFRFIFRMTYIPHFDTNYKILKYTILAEEVPDFVDFMKNNYPPGFTYADFAKDFTAEFYDPVAWANLFKDAGAK